MSKELQLLGFLSRAPFMAVFNFKAVKFAQCTCSLLNDYWGISAAHCLGPKEKVRKPA